MQRVKLYCPTCGAMLAIRETRGVFRRRECTGFTIHTHYTEGEEFIDVSVFYRAQTLCRRQSRAEGRTRKERDPMPVFVDRRLSPLLARSPRKKLSTGHLVSTNGNTKVYAMAEQGLKGILDDPACSAPVPSATDMVSDDSDPTHGHHVDWFSFLLRGHGA